MSRFISPPELLSRIKNKVDVKIIDVRDGDFVDHKIQGAQNYPSEAFTTNGAKKLMEEIQKEKTKEVVFHCQYSQQRGPRSALFFRELLKEQGLDSCQVLVLEGGYQGFHKHAKETGHDGYLEEL